MNVRRGLWRAWIFVTVLWLIGTAGLAYLVMPDQIARKYQYVYNMRKDVGDPNKVDWSKDFYALMRSPSKEQLSATFDLLEYQYVTSWNEDVQKGTMIAADFPDRSRLYLSAQLTKEDQNYVSKAFWDQRWERYAKEAVPFVAGAILPPLVLLLLGSSLVWVGRGFRT
ncbi:hypothetical protein CQ14_07080 [Bradyrhizobium lablabi]|uniref:Uncharacterized protein n=2 Tax=Bradyrhizobium lablabi TaxID=722472 RepID=A0A0R3MNR6_9BRAD|nr:hypothetical protein CQ14_07080 [Bradyrhizobium lablabi]